MSRTNYGRRSRGHQDCWSFRGRSPSSAVAAVIRLHGIGMEKVLRRRTPPDLRSHIWQAAHQEMDAITATKVGDLVVSFERDRQIDGAGLHQSDA